MSGSLLHHVVVGRATQPSVLFLHGFMGSSADWQKPIASLHDAYRCIAVDLPGHGASTGLPDAAYTMTGASKALIEVLDAHGIDQCAVVGYSMGGRLAVYFALHHAERCMRLVLESASPGLATAAERATRREVDADRAWRLETGDFDAFLNAWYRQPLFASFAKRDGLVEHMVRTRRANDPTELARSLRGMGTGQQPSLWERLSGWPVATLAVAGTLDAKYVALARRMAAASPRMRAVVVPHAGHTIHAERPRRFIALLRAFLQPEC